MADLGAISMALTSLKTSTDLTKALLSLRDANLVREKAVELTAEIFTARESALSAQASQASLLEEIRNLKSQIEQFEDWEREKVRYQLAEIAPGVFVYETKPGMEAGEPAHKICAHCYQDRRRSILQASNRAGHLRTNTFLTCNACTAEILVATKHLEIAAPANPRRDWFDRG